jgi:hypothetical protein
LSLSLHLSFFSSFLIVGSLLFTLSCRILSVFVLIYLLSFLPHAAYDRSVCFLGHIPSTNQTGKAITNIIYLGRHTSFGFRMGYYPALREVLPFFGVTVKNSKIVTTVSSTTLQSLEFIVYNNPLSTLNVRSHGSSFVIALATGTTTEVSSSSPGKVQNFHFPMWCRQTLGSTQQFSMFIGGVFPIT